MKSMTGMGRGRGVVQGVPIRVEVKSVNHRFCDVNIRAHGKYNVLEVPITTLVKKCVGRGRVDIYIAEEKTAQPSPADVTAYRACFEYLTNIKNALKLKEDVGLGHLIQGVPSWGQRELDAGEAWREFEPILKGALDELNKMRSVEGGRLKKDITRHFLEIDKIRGEIKAAAGEVSAELQKRLKQRLTEKLEKLKELDPDRLHMEAVYYVDRMDITEELERLKSHMAVVEDLFAMDEPVGRKIEFLLQEFNREFNTIASKCQNAEVAHLVVDAKSELEKIREQVQNIE